MNIEIRPNSQFLQVTIKNGNEVIYDQLLDKQEYTLLTSNFAEMTSDLLNRLI